METVPKIQDSGQDSPRDSSTAFLKVKGLHKKPENFIAEIAKRVEI
jgi:hypothetical protein